MVGCFVSEPVLLPKPRGGNPSMSSTGAGGTPVKRKGLVGSGVGWRRGPSLGRKDLVWKWGCSPSQGEGVLLLEAGEVTGELQIWERKVV